MHNNMLVNVSGLTGHTMPIVTSQGSPINVGSNWQHFSNFGRPEEAQETSRFSLENSIPGYHS